MKTIKFLLLSIILVSFSGCKNPSKILIKKIKEAIGSDIKGFKVLSYPVNNFGVGTLYSQGTSTNNFICDSWNCIGVSDENIPKDNLEKWLSMNGTVATGVGGTIQIDQKCKKEYALQVLLPKIFSMVNLSSDLNKSELSNISLNINRAYKRVLRRYDFSQAIQENPDENLVSQFNQDNLFVTYGDLVIDGLSLTVKTKGITKSNFEAKLEDSTSKIIGTDADMKLEYTRESDGTFTFKSITPLVVAIMVAKQSSSSGQSGDNNIDYIDDISPASSDLFSTFENSQVGILFDIK